MFKINKMFVAILAVSFLFMAQSGCVRKGAAERTGEKIDKTVNKAGKKVDKAFK